MQKIVVVVIGPPPEPSALGAEAVYMPVEEGVTGRHEPVGAIALLPDGPVDVGGARVEAYRVEHRVQWDRAGETVARVSFVHRRPGLSSPEFAEHWARVHAPLARRHHPTLLRYVQNDVFEVLTPGAPEVDGIAELGFASLRDVHHRMYDSPAGAGIIRRDIQRFLDVPRGWRMLARRVTHRDERTGAPSALTTTRRPRSFG